MPKTGEGYLCDECDQPVPNPECSRCRLASATEDEEDLCRECGKPFPNPDCSRCTRGTAVREWLNAHIATPKPVRSTLPKSNPHLRSRESSRNSNAPKFSTDTSPEPSSHMSTDSNAPYFAIAFDPHTPPAWRDAMGRPVGALAKPRSRTSPLGTLVAPGLSQIGIQSGTSALPRQNMPSSPKLVPLGLSQVDRELQNAEVRQCVAQDRLSESQAIEWLRERISALDLDGDDNKRIEDELSAAMVNIGISREWARQMISTESLARQVEKAKRAGGAPKFTASQLAPNPGAGTLSAPKKTLPKSREVRGPLVEIGYFESGMSDSSEDKRRRRKPVQEGSASGMLGPPGLDRAVSGSPALPGADNLSPAKKLPRPPVSGSSGKPSGRPSRK